MSILVNYKIVIQSKYEVGDLVQINVEDYWGSEVIIGVITHIGNRTNTPFDLYKSYKILQLRGTITHLNEWDNNYYFMFIGKFIKNDSTRL